MKITEDGREFIHVSHPDAPRLIVGEERCTCRVRKQYDIQCRHEICERGGKFCVDLIGKRNLFYPKLHSMVKRNSNIAGESFHNSLVDECNSDTCLDMIDLKDNVDSKDDHTFQEEGSNNIDNASLKRNK